MEMVLISDRFCCCFSFFVHTHSTHYIHLNYAKKDKIKFGFSFVFVVCMCVFFCLFEWVSIHLLTFRIVAYSCTYTNFIYTCYYYVFVYIFIYLKSIADDITNRSASDFLFRQSIDNTYHINMRVYNVYVFGFLYSINRRKPTKIENRNNRFVCLFVLLFTIFSLDRSPSLAHIQFVVVVYYYKIDLSN